MLSILRLTSAARLPTKKIVAGARTASRLAKVVPPPGCSTDKQSIPAIGDFKHGVMRSGLLANENYNYVENLWPEKVSNLYDAFLLGKEVSNDGPCFGAYEASSNTYKYCSYAEAHQMATNLGSALVNAFRAPVGNSTRIGIYAKNSPEVFLTILACTRHSMVHVPIYDTLGCDAASYIVGHSEIHTMVVDKFEKLERMIYRKKHDNLTTLEHIIVVEMTGINPEIVQLAQSVGLTVTSFEDALQKGKENPAEPSMPKLDDTYILCYTSGTTGVPKGVILSNRNVIAGLSGFHIQLSSFGPGGFTPDDVFFSYLPLSHIFGQASDWSALTHGARIAFYRGDAKRFTEDMQLAKPTVFFSVPRILGIMSDAIKKNLEKTEGLKLMLFNYAYAKKLQRLRNGDFRHDFLEKIVFKPIRDVTGGKVRYSIVGSAPLAKETLETIRVTLGATILEGYGQTENCALGTIVWSNDVEGGWIGPPAPCSVMKLGDVPELGYFAAEGKGELRIKGPTVTSGYFKDDEKTAELFDEDGFLCTGDIAEILPNGVYKIFDRKKNIFKLAQGEYVAPEKIENVYGNATVVNQIFVDGDSLERHLVAVVVPDYGIVSEWYKKNVENKDLSFEELCRNEKVREFVFEALQKTGEEGQLNHIEQVKAIYLESEAFSIENGLITPTHKTKRADIRKKYTEVRERLYREMKKTEKSPEIPF